MKRTTVIIAFFLLLGPSAAFGQLAGGASGDPRSVFPGSAEQSPGGFYEVARRFDPPLLEPAQPHAVQQRYFEKQPRAGILQQVYHGATRITADSNSLSLTELDFSATFGFPLPTREAPLLITPAFGLDVLQTSVLDVPNELYDATLEIRTLRPFGDYWTFDLAITPGVFGNTDTSESQFRLQGRAVGIYQWRPDTKAVLGVAYLDRDDYAALPVFGLIWTPTDDWKFDLLFPKPRIALRTHQDDRSAWWAYISGEFGGGSWGMTRAGGAADTVTIRDLRLLFGVERESDGATFRLEGGYVFAREIEYGSGVGDQDLKNGGLVRGVIYY